MKIFNPWEEYVNGFTRLRAIDLEDLPCAFDITFLNDNLMNLIVEDIELNYQYRTKNIDLSLDRKSEIWWQEMERTLNIYQIPYIEDYDEIQFVEYEQRRNKLFKDYMDSRRSTIDE